MTIVERNASRRFAKWETLAGSALVAAAVFSATPKSAFGELDYLGSGGTTTNPNSAGAASWFNASDWNSTSVVEGTGTLPESNINAASVQNIIGPNVSMPSIGVVFDPRDDAKTPGGPNANYVANLANIQGSFYIASITSATRVNPNKLTVESGTIIAGSTTIGRDADGILALNGGTFITEQEFKVQGQNKFTLLGTGTFEYHGGNLLVNGAVHVGAGVSSAGVSLTSAGVGYFVVYNDGPAGAMLSANGFDMAPNATSAGTIGIAEFHFDLNMGGIGGTRPVQSNWNNGAAGINDGILNLNNGTNTSARLNLVLDAAPTVTNGVAQNLGLFDQTLITNFGTYPTAFYSVDGSTVFTQGATISAAYLGKTYSWTISYSGQINFTDTAASAYNPTAVQATGGDDVVLVGLVPEPGSAALIGSVGSLILARRRRRKG
jgi:hypothetical protein